MPPPPCFRVLFGKVQKCSILRDQTTGDLNPIICKFYLCPPSPPFLSAVHEKKFFLSFLRALLASSGGGARAPQAPPWVRHWFRVSCAVLCSRIGTQLTRKRPRDLLKKKCPHIFTLDYMHEYITRLLHSIFNYRKDIEWRRSSSKLISVL